MGFKIFFEDKINTVNQIVEGVVNNVIVNERIEALYKERISICNNCVGKSKDGNQKLGMESKICSATTFHDYKGEVVSGCGCFLNIKARSEEAKCPIDKW